MKFLKSFQNFKNRFCKYGFAQIPYLAPGILFFVIYINTIIFLVNISRSQFFNISSPTQPENPGFNPALLVPKLRVDVTEPVDVMRKLNSRK